MELAWSYTENKWWQVLPGTTVTNQVANHSYISPRFSVIFITSQSHFFTRLTPGIWSSLSVAYAPLGATRDKLSKCCAMRIYPTVYKQEKHCVKWILTSNYQATELATLPVSSNAIWSVYKECLIHTCINRLLKGWQTQPEQ